MQELLNIHGLLLERILVPVATDTNRTLCAAVLFDCWQGMDYRTRRDFIQSGTIHILTVSRLHVRMFARVLFFLFAFLPFRIRCMIIPFFTTLYALSTGMQKPAFRALIMLSS